MRNPNTIEATISIRRHESWIQLWDVSCR